MTCSHYEQGDVLLTRPNAEPVARGVAQANVHIRYAADGELAELVVLDAKAQGRLSPRLKFPLSPRSVSMG